MLNAVRNPERPGPSVWPLSRSLAATKEIEFSFSSYCYLDVSVHSVPFCTLWIHAQILEVCSSRFPHSEISGSKAVCASPKLIAAYHVFHRLLVPRHSPCALSCLTSHNVFTLFILKNSFFSGMFCCSDTTFCNFRCDLFFKENFCFLD